MGILGRRALARIVLVCSAALFAALWLLAAPSPGRAQVTSVRVAPLTFVEAPGGTHTATPVVWGASSVTIQCDAPGPGTSWDYTLTSRLCDRDDCGDWEATALDSGSVADTGTLEISLGQPRWQLQFVITETAGAPVVACRYLIRP